MKRYIHSSEGWNVSEPSAYEYGKAISEGYRRMNERYAPFEIHSVYFHSGSANSTGYSISLKIPYRAYYEWIAHNKNAGSFRSAEYVLYGPANSHISGYTQMVKAPKLGTFSSIDGVMSFLFREYSDLLDQLDEDEEEDEIEFDINTPVPASHIPGDPKNFNEVMCPSCMTIFKKASRCPECGQLIDYTNWK